MQRMVVAESDIFARDPLHLLVALSAYYGAPIIALAVLGAFWGRSAKRDVMLFLVIASVVPVVELLVIIIGTNVLTTWYYAFIALIPVVTLASIGLISLAQRGHRAMALVPLDRVQASTTPPLRSRISPPCTAIGLAGKRGARMYSQQAADFKMPPNSQVYASVPGIIAYYLGLDPARTLDQTVIQSVPEDPPKHGVGDQWFIVEAKQVSAAYASWFASRCALEASYEARTGPADRSVLVSRCRAVPG